MNRTYQRAIDTSPFRLMFGTGMNSREEINVEQMIEIEIANDFNIEWDFLRVKAKLPYKSIEYEKKTKQLTTPNANRRQRTKLAIWYQFHVHNLVWAWSYVHHRIAVRTNWRNLWETTVMKRRPAQTTWNSGPTIAWPGRPSAVFYTVWAPANLAFVVSIQQYINWNVSPNLFSKRKSSTKRLV